MRKLIRNKNGEVIVNLQQLLFYYIKVIDLKQNTIQLKKIENSIKSEIIIEKRYVNAR